MRWTTILGVTVLACAGLSCTSAQPENEADLAFQAADFSRAAIAYQRSEELHGTLDPESRFRLALACAAGTTEGGTAAARTQVALLLARDEDDGRAAALEVILGRLAGLEDRISDLEEEKAGLRSLLADERRAMARTTLALESVSRRELAQCEDELAILRDELAQSRRGLEAADACCRELQQQINELKRIDLEEPR